MGETGKVTVTVGASIEGPCPDCGGTGIVTGIVYSPVCTVCDREYEPDTIRAWFEERRGRILDGETLPCGHDWTRLREERDCLRCSGSGLAFASRDVTGEYEELLDVVRQAAARPHEAQEIMGTNGLAVENLQDPWQKLAFTFYTMHVEMATAAESALRAVAAATALEEGQDG